MLTVWTIFVLATLLTNIIFVNMLVAIMSRTFNRTIQNAHFSLKEQVEILSDWSWIVNVGWSLGARERVNYMFSVVPVDEEGAENIELQLHDVTRALQQVQETLVKQGNRQVRLEAKL